MFKTRIITAALLLLLFLAALFYLPDYGWIALNLLITAAAAWEWGQLGKLQPVWLFVSMVSVVCAALVYVAQGLGDFDLMLYALALMFWLIAAPFWLIYQWRAGKFWFTACGLLVLASTCLALVQLRESGAGLLLWLLSVVWVADSAAFFCGKKFGKRKLVPAISPGKTWEGVWGAVLAVTLYALAIAAASENHGIIVLGKPLPWYGILLAHWVITLLSIVGDLFESLLKRQAGVKDSGTLLPGHGGVLDRVDGLTSSLPVMAFFIFALFK
ncbi:MAG: phosphatidate cytidylyltransferase [Burkholderiales bacterium]